jgi:hypothetical protein
MTKNLTERKPVKNLLEMISIDKRSYFFAAMIKYDLFSLPFNVALKRLQWFKDILVNNDNFFFEKYEKYCSLHNSSYEALEIRYGKTRADEYKEKLLSRPKIDRSKQNKYSAEYISNIKSISLEEAEKVVKNRKKKKSIESKNMHQKLKKSGYSYRENNPMCIEYYIKRGSDEKEANELLRLHLEKTRNSIDGFFMRYGDEDIAIEKYSEYIKNRKLTWFEKYGRNTPMLPRTSKESLKFFIPLYKNIRRLGLQKEDIQWGIAGSREFFIGDEGDTFAYDFTIKSIKYIIEYNGSFWHSNPLGDYKGFLSEDIIIAKDYKKKNVAIKKGFRYKTVWDTDDFSLVRKQILKEVGDML